MDATISLIDTVGQSLTEQCQMFLWSIAIGAMLGVLYDVFRTIRKIVIPSVILNMFEDVLYFAITSLVIFIFFLKMTEGHIRWFALVGMCLGSIIYFLIISKPIIILFDALIFIVGKIIKLVKKILAILLSPFLFLFSKIAKLFGYIIVKIRRQFIKALKAFNFSKLKRKKENIPILKEIQHLPFK